MIIGSAFLPAPAYRQEGGVSSRLAREVFSSLLLLKRDHQFAIDLRSEAFRPPKAALPGKAILLLYVVPHAATLRGGACGALAGH
jgi:hypothetical protein